MARKKTAENMIAASIKKFNENLEKLYSQIAQENKYFKVVFGNKLE